MRLKASLILAIKERNRSPTLMPVPKSANVPSGISIENRFRSGYLTPKIDQWNLDFHAGFSSPHFKLGHCKNQIRPLRPETGQYPKA
jgi:hypothetical protein